MDIIDRRCLGGPPDRIREVPRSTFIPFCPRQDLPIWISSITTSADGRADRHSVQGIGLQAYRMGMGDRRVLSCPLANRLRVLVGSEDAQRADPHHRAVGPAGPIGSASRTAGAGRYAIEGPGVQPKELRFSGFIGILPP